MHIKKHIPNAITCLNLLSGAASIVFALHELQLEVAALLIILAAVFDFFDGLVARALGVSSPIGKDLDSLADVISFGLAPAMLVLHALLLEGVGLWEAMPVLFIAAFAALRLAKFNNDTRQTTSFIGLPVPASALFWIGVYTLIHPSALLLGADLVRWLLYPLVAVMCYLGVSELPMFSFKLKGLKGAQYQLVLIAVAVVTVGLWGFVGCTLTILAYILLSILKTTTEGSVQKQ